jgi:hypothetical protein
VRRHHRVRRPRVHHHLRRRPCRNTHAASVSIRAGYPCS